MTVLTIKAKAKKHAASGSLVAQANSMATDLLEEKSDRVLVVYGKQAASIYYEGAEAPEKPPLKT